LGIMLARWVGESAFFDGEKRLHSAQKQPNCFLESFQNGQNTGGQSGFNLSVFTVLT